MSFSFIWADLTINLLVFVSSVFVFIDVIVYVPAFSPIFSVARPLLSVCTVYSVLLTLNTMFQKSKKR